MRIIIANSNKLLNGLNAILKEEFKAKVINISSKTELTEQNILKLAPDFILFLHWSHKIPKNIWSRYECIVFHMTDLPYGRGGSPLQNLIVRGKEITKISALKCAEGIDEGNIYLKRSLSLGGNATEIFSRVRKIITEMIIKIIKEDIKPIPQKGEVVRFKRRTPKQSNIENIANINKLYDHIRMLDADGYPHAFLENKYFRMEFLRATLNADESITADVRIFKK